MRMISSWVWHSRSAQRRPWRSVEQQILGAGARLRQRRLEPARYGGAQFALAARMGVGQRFEIGDDGGAVDQFLGGARRSFGIKHH